MDTLRPIGSFRPGTLAVQKKPYGPIQFWPPPRGPGYIATMDLDLAEDAAMHHDHMEDGPVIEEIAGGEDGDAGMEEDLLLMGAAPALAPAPPPLPVPHALPAVPPPPPPYAPPAGGRRRQRPEITVEVEGGSISYYASKNSFQAVCTNPFHGDCVLTRKCTTAANMKGRPLGLLSAFLKCGSTYTDKDAHWANIIHLSYDFAERKQCRESVMDTANGRIAALFERSVPGEHPELQEPPLP